jgi:hypothetical protein
MNLTAWLVDQGIRSISLNPDAVLTTTVRIAAVEKAGRRQIEKQIGYSAG